VLAGGVFIAAALLIALFAGAGFSASLTWLVWTTGAVLFVLFYWIRAMGWRDLGDPIIFYPTLIWLVFGLVSLLPRPPQPNAVTELLTEEVLVTTYGLVLLGLACFMVAYAAMARPTEQIVLTKEALAEMDRARVLVVIFFVTAARLVLVSVGRYGFIVSDESGVASLSYAGLLGMFVDLSPFVLILVSLLAFGEGGRRSDKVLFIVIMLFEGALGFVSGMKAGVALPVVAATLGYLYARGRLPIKTLVISFLVFLFLIPGFQYYRVLLSGSGERVDSPVEALGFSRDAVEETVRSPQISERVTIGFDLLVGRLDELRAFAVIYWKTPDPVPYELGKNYYGAPVYNIIPRILWPTKPQIGTIGGATAEDYYGITGGTSITRTILGDFYANFGTAGVIGGMLIFGVATGVLRRRFVRDRDVRSLLLYGVAFFTLLDHEANFAGLLAGLPRLIVLVVLAGWFVTPHRPRKGRRAPAT
jgi:hypothetical protein